MSENKIKETCINCNKSSYGYGESSQWYGLMCSEYDKSVEDNYKCEAFELDDAHKVNALKKEIERLKKENEALRKCVEFYAGGEIGNDLEVRPEKRELWNIPDRWAQRSMSDHYAGKLARQTLKELGEKDVN